ncbi:hypothetical protein EJ04DRAFT_434454 [Polyplosphaeria fusca]|uniref:RING-type domain-containing protein n=1 Tax=Polyplosphaeria fusca TaxID=682080 RepID=A0A9P4R2U5_9PLEO|nr:hypothetical protein EJ04DRAFT_434454 [Polyplosphaeria fusca]
MATSRSTEDGTNKNGKNVTVAIILPCLFAVILVILLVIVKAQQFVDWAKKQRLEHPGAPLPPELSHPLCVICLEEIEDAAQIRGLGCFHVFHQECLDDWFSRWNEYCPLCHRPIVQNVKQIKKKSRTDEYSGTQVGLLV